MASRSNGGASTPGFWPADLPQPALMTVNKKIIATNGQAAATRATASNDPTATTSIVRIDFSSASLPADPLFESVGDAD